MDCAWKWGEQYCALLCWHIHHFSN